MDISQISRHGRGLILPKKTAVLQQNADDKEGDNVIKETLELLEEGETEIMFDNMHKDVIMLLGNTGSGKSTFAQWIAGDNTQLISKETEEGSGEYIIEGRTISNSTLKSHTIFPELIVEEKTNSAYYDCSGFSDTQGTSREIAETYFVKKVLDFSKSLKMVFVISHPSVRKGVDRQDFMKLLRHVTDLVKDTSKFNNSIALVATKVDNQYVKRGNNFELVGDKKVIDGIAGFLQEAKEYLMDNLNRLNVSGKEKIFYENAIQFVDILLEKEGETYPKIGIFRRPDMPGPVSEIPLLQKGKLSIEIIVYRKLLFTSKNNEDFGYTVSEATKNDINDLVEEINKNLWSRLSNIAGKIQVYCENLVKEIRGKINSFVSSANVIDANPSDAELFMLKFISAYNSTSELVRDTSNLTNPGELPAILNRTISNLDAEIPEDDIAYIAVQGSYFNFLQTISDKDLSSKQWNQLFKGEEIFLSESEIIILQDARAAAKEINLKIQINLNDTLKRTEEEYTEKVKSIEIQKLPKMLKKDYGIIIELTKEIRNETSIEELVNATRKISENLDVAVPEKKLQNLKNQGKYSKYLAILSNENSKVDPVKRLSPFENFASYLYKSEKWYTFLEDLFNRFSEYNIQKERQRYNVADLKDWGQSNKPQGISVTNNSFKEFLKKIEAYKVAEYETIKNISSPTGLQIDELNQALSMTLKHRPVVRCSESSVIVKGSFIVLKESMHYLLSNADTDGGCNNFKALLEEGKYKLFKVFALKRVFIDADLSFVGDGMSVAFISPEWEVVGSRSIDIRGKDGAPLEKQKAKNGAHAGSDGKSGVPGNPGISGESFFGIGDTFVGGKNLTINSGGCKGGRGQNGGDGAAGVPGTDAAQPSVKDSDCEKGFFRGFKCEYVSSETLTEPTFVAVSTTYKIHGLPAGKGGDGGSGGKGGKGGDAGNIRILELSRHSEIKELVSKGKEGEGGEGGTGGPGVKNGDDKISEFTRQDFFDCLFGECKITQWVFRETKTNGNSSEGSKGEDGGNVEGIKDPVPGTGIERPSDQINEYKIFLRENINNRFNKYSILRFLEKLNNSTDVRNLYDVLALIGEFQGLEEQFQALNDQFNFSLSYRSLLERINEFAKSQKGGLNSNENKKAISYLYTATLGRIYNLKENSQDYLIINIRGYLNVIKENLKILKDIKTQNNKVEVIRKYKENYKSGIDKKIDEAVSFIENQLTPEIENINAKIDDQVDSLIEETIALQKKGEKEREKLMQKKRDLAKSLLLKGVLSCFKIVSGFAKLVGPTGRIAGAVMDAANTVGEQFVLSDQKKSLDLPPDVAASITDIVKQIKTMRNKKVTYLQNVLDDLSEEIKKHPEKLGDMAGKINNLKEELKEFGEKNLDYKQLKRLESDLNEELKRKRDELKQNPNDKESVEALKVIEKIAKILQFGSLLLNNKTKDDEEKMDTAIDSVKDLENRIVELREYEENIYGTMVPMLNEMIDQMKDVIKKLGTESQVSLDVTKWKVQSSLKDMRLQMQQLTEGFSVKNNLSRSIEKLDEVMTTLITIYDRIQSYKDQQNLANYIADISSVSASSIDVKNQQLANALNRLEFAIRANIVLEQYKSAVNALKQWVFPFADQYMEESLLPSKIRLDTNIEDLTRSATRQIEAIKQNIDLYDASIKNGDEYLQYEEFSSRYVSSRPFFVWKSGEYNRSISNLFSGEKAVFIADVKYSAPYKDAIKFSEIDFHFKTKNETDQYLLSEILKEFDIIATHVGNSYYRYEKKTFLITSDSVTISYSYEKDTDGKPIRSNRVYNMLKSGDLLLSPYTLWEVKLLNQTNQYSFTDLESFKSKTSLELSGFGSYVNTNILREPSTKSVRTGLNDCGRSKHRVPRLTNEAVVDRDYVTNVAPNGTPSPINFICNFLKTYLVSNAINSLNRIFVGEQRYPRVCENCPDMSNEHTEAKNIGSKWMPLSTIGKVERISAENDYKEVRTGSISDNNFKVNFTRYSSSSESILLSDQTSRGHQICPQVPDLNFSLLLADLITRTVTGNKYKSPVDECLLSPREVILGKICNGSVQNESGIKQMLQRHQSEKEEPSSFFSKLTIYAKSVLQNLGLVGNEGPEEYVQDVWRLFA